jgi:hypothetical protein
VRSRWIGVAAAAGLLAAVTGCGEDGVSQAGDDPRVFIYDRGVLEKVAEPDTTVAVTLRYEPDGECLYLDGGDQSWAPLWPDGTTGVSRGEERGVSYPGFGEIMADSTVTATGKSWDPPVEDVPGLDQLDNCLPPDGVMAVTQVTNA